MPTETLPNSTSRTLRIALVAEIVFLAVAGFFMFTEHRAHYLGALPYALIIVSITVCFWLQAECRKHLANLGSPPEPGGERKKGV